MTLSLSLEYRAVVKFVRLLIFIDVLLVVVYVVNTLLGAPNVPLTRLINLDAESNIPAWYSSAQLLVISLVIFAAVHNERYRLQGSRRAWTLLAAGFLFLSFDEGAVFHEKITAVLKPWEWIPRFRGDHGIWIFFYSLIGVALIVLGRHHIRAFRRMYPRSFRYFVLGAGMFVLGGVAIEILGYQYFRFDETSLAYFLQVVVEEALEMTGCTVLLYSMLRLLTGEGMEN